MTERRHNLLIAGGVFHDFAATAPDVAVILRSQGIESEIVMGVPAGFARLAEARFDLVTVHCLAWSMTQHPKYEPHRATDAFDLPVTARQALQAHVAAGGGLLGLHTAPISFDTWPEWGSLLGVRWVWGQSHHPLPCPVSLSITEPAHPLMKGLEGFTVQDELYCALNLAADVQVLATATAEGVAPQPVVTVREAGGRVVYSALGHGPESLAAAGHRALIGRAAGWACGLV